MTDHIKALITTYGAACARVARAPRLSPAQDEALRLERVAHDALVAAVTPKEPLVVDIGNGASYTLRLIADSGYTATTAGRCTSSQYAAAISALENGS